MPTPPTADPPAVTHAVEEWVELRVKVPASWKNWLEEAARARALSVAALVRQCIRALMITRHDEHSQ